jgi:hypothetical protein
MGLAAFRFKGERPAAQSGHSVEHPCPLSAANNGLVLTANKKAARFAHVRELRTIPGTGFLL